MSAGFLFLACLVFTIFSSPYIQEWAKIPEDFETIETEVKMVSMSCYNTVPNSLYMISALSVSTERDGELESERERERSLHACTYKHTYKIYTILNTCDFYKLRPIQIIRNIICLIPCIYLSFVGYH